MENGIKKRKIPLKKTETTLTTSGFVPNKSHYPTVESGSEWANCKAGVGIIVLKRVLTEVVVAKKTIQKEK